MAAALVSAVGYHVRMGYDQWYKAVSAPFRNPKAKRLVNVLDKGLVYAIACAYVAALAYLAITADVRFWRALLVPAITFVIVTLLRAAVNAPRPYESFDIDPLIQKSTCGKSLPSRHLSSALAISCALLWLTPLPGAIALAASVLVAATRIVGGVHFPRDIIAAAAVAFACAAFGYWIV